MCHSSLTDFVSELVAGNSLFFPDSGLGGGVGGPGFGFLISRPWEFRDLVPRVLFLWCLPSLAPPDSDSSGADITVQGCLRTGFSDSTDLEGVGVVGAPSQLPVKPLKQRGLF